MKKMSCLLLIIITCGIACNRTNCGQGTQMIWATQLTTKLEEIERDFKKMTTTEIELTELLCFRRTPNDSEIVELENYYRLVLEIKQGLYELWSLSRICMFLDINDDTLIENTPLIIRRYQKFLKTNKNISYDKLTRMNMESNIDAISTCHYVHALDVLQDCILFEDHAHSTSPAAISPKEKEQRELARKAMDQWYHGNEDLFIWEESLKSFRIVGGNDRLPTEVVELYMN